MPADLSGDVESLGAASPGSASSASDVSSSRLIRNTLVNGVAKSSSALATAIVLPFLLQRLGPEEYGIWLLALGMTFTSGYLAVADLGLTDAAVKFIAEARAEHRTITVSEIASTTAATFTAIAVVLAFAMAVFAPLLVDIFRVPTELADVARLVFVLMALEIAVGLPGAAFRAVIEGAQRYTLLSVVDIASRLGWAVSAVALVLLGHGVVALAVASLTVAALKTVATLVGAYRAQPGLQISTAMANRATLKRTWSYGSFVGGLRVLQVVYAQLDRVVIGILLGVAAVSRYEIAFRMNSLAVLPMAIAPSAALPAAAYNAARGDTTRQRELYLRGSKYTVAVVLPVCIAGMFYAGPIIETWIGEGYGSMAGPSRLFLAYSLFACINQLGTTMLIGLGQAKRVLRLQVACVTVNLAASLALARPLGITGVILGTVLGEGVIWVPYARLLLRTFAVDLATWFRRIVLPNVPGAVAQVVVGLFTLEWSRGLEDLWLVGVLLGASMTVSIGVFGAVGLGGEERRHLLSRVGWGSRRKNQP